MIEFGSRVRIKATAYGSDRRYAGHIGRVVEFDSTLPWQSPRSLLAWDQFICVHFEPRSKKQIRDGSPIRLIAEESLVVINGRADSRVKT